MKQASNRTPDQGILSAWPQTRWRRSLATVGLLLALVMAELPTQRPTLVKLPPSLAVGVCLELL
jgi:hypothetical protein